MIDTVNTKVDRSLTPELLKKIEDGKGAYRQDGWYIKISPDLDYMGIHRTKLWGEHTPTGIVVRGHNDVVELTQASLPSVLFGCNGQLIRSPQQLDEAQLRLKTILDEVSTVTGPRHEYVRVDLVLHFRGDIAKFIAAHRHCRHPLIRNETYEYGPHGLKLQGSVCGISFYDKQEEMKLGPGNILRVEVQLRKPKLNELFGRGKMPLYSLDFSTCYRVYRKILCAFTPAPISEVFNFNTLLAHCEASGCTMPNGSSAMENYRASVKHDTYLDRRRQINGMTLSAAAIDWSQLLPEKLLPTDLPDVIRTEDSILN